MTIDESQTVRVRRSLLPALRVLAKKEGRAVHAAEGADA